MAVLLFQVFQGYTGSLNDKLGKITVCTLNGGFYFLNDPVWKSDGF